MNKKLVDLTVMDGATIISFLALMIACAWLFYNLLLLLHYRIKDSMSDRRERNVKETLERWNKEDADREAAKNTIEAKKMNDSMVKIHAVIHKQQDDYLESLKKQKPAVL